MKVWNQHNKQHPLDLTEVLTELIGLAWFNERLHFTDNLEYIFDNSFLDENDVPDFLLSSSQQDYYQPTKTNIAYFTHPEFDEGTAQYKKYESIFS